MALTLEEKEARSEFLKLYGKITRDVVRRIARGQNSFNIAASLTLPESSVMAFRANVTRGTYWPFLEGERTTGFSGSCNF